MSGTKPLGAELNETAYVMTARKRYPCQEYRCAVVIASGELYVRAVLFPGHESGYAVDGPVHWKFCVGCATRYGRPLPPVLDRSQRVDEEAVRIAVAGERVVRLNRAERREAVRRLMAAGVIITEMARRIGVTPRSINRLKAKVRAS
jgi:hypothetical protein